MELNLAFRRLSSQLGKLSLQEKVITPMIEPFQ